MFQSKHFNPPKSSKLFLCKCTAVPSFKRQPGDKFEQEETVSFENNAPELDKEYAPRMMNYVYIF